MKSFWYIKITHDHPNMERTDFRISRNQRRRLLRGHLLAKSLAEHFKKQRLHQTEIDEWDKTLATGQSLDAVLIQKIRLALAEGVLKDDLRTIDEDAFIGTCGQLVFKWIRTQYYGDQIVRALPDLLTDSSKKQGTDYLEILGDPTKPDSLHFIVWEIKATDSDVASRSDEIYQMHKKRTPRLLRGLELTLSLEYPADEHPILGDFVRHLLDHWLKNTASKKLGGAVIFDTSYNPGDVFTTFHTQFPELHSAACRQVLLIEVPKFRKTRKKLWNHLLTQMS